MDTLCIFVLYLDPQTPDSALGLMISGGSLAFWLSSARDRFPVV
jgi:hypothetical protein